SGTVYSGDGTWFNLGLGSCGQDNNDSEFVAAMNAPQMENGANPNSNPMCGKDILITNPANNKTVTVKIVDTCPPCTSGSVDLSPAAFSNISDLDVGRIKIDW
ncbi:RlpA-like double-psi beta-barrel-protein domain-containing protein-containing protein, partial [Pilaira anomala]